MGEKDFKFGNGSSISDINGLWNSLGEMDDGTFRSYVNDEKNDFANWVKDVLNDNELAEKLFATKDKGESLKAVEDRIREGQIKKVKTQLAEIERKEQEQRAAAFEKVKQMKAALQKK